MVSNSGYERVDLFKDKKRKQHSIHRLVATAFVENPNGYPMVNHKDENRRNNLASNLEWCNASYNRNYGNGEGKRRTSVDWFYKSDKFKRMVKTTGEKNRRKFGKPVTQMDLIGNEIQTYPSVNEAFKQTHIRHIHEACEGKYKTAGGYKWKYERSKEL